MKKAVINVDLRTEKCRRKAMKIAAVSPGVISVSLEGESTDQVVVTGDRVDPVCLTNQMRKKFRCASLVSFEDVAASTEDKKDTGGEKEEEPTPEEHSPLACVCRSYPPPFPTYYHVVYDDPCTNSCSIL